MEDCAKRQRTADLPVASGLSGLDHSIVFLALLLATAVPALAQTSASPTAASEKPFPVTNIRFEGNTLLPEAELVQAVAR